MVTADADGQHDASDVIAVGEQVARDPLARRLVVGSRAFDGDVPLRSRVGNTATRWLFAIATRRRLIDTQSGLRGLPPGLLAWAADVPGRRYDYELQVLLRAPAAGIALQELPITTIYLDDNRSSHFRPVVDSLRIYLPLLGFLASSLAAFLVDTALLLVLQAVTGHLLMSVVCARLVSAGFNFTLNRRVLFDRHRRCRTRAALTRYAALASVVLALNYLLLLTLTSVLPLLPAKVGAEMLLVALSFTAQRYVVFRPTADSSDTPDASAADPQPAHSVRPSPQQVG